VFSLSFSAVAFVVSVPQLTVDFFYKFNQNIYNLNSVLVICINLLNRIFLSKNNFILFYANILF